MHIGLVSLSVISFILILSSIIFWFMAYNAATSKFSVYATNELNIVNSNITVKNVDLAIKYLLNI